VTILQIILIAYVFVGCVYWLRMAVGALRIRRAVTRLANLDPPQPDSWPKLSVIVPACNEEDTIEAAVTTLLAQDYPQLEVILVDDRSTDATGEIIDRIADADGRVRKLHVRELPDGWLGKVHALQRGAELAQGQWLLLTDADVHLSGDVLRRTVAYCEHRALDHLAAVPDMWRSTFMVDTVISLFLRTFSVGMRCWAIEDPHSSAFIGVGAFNLVRRSALQRTPGFQWLRLEVADDVGLGMMLKRSGARCCLVDATGHVGLHWYRSLAAMARGAEKGFASIAKCRMWRILVICALLIGLELAPLAALLPLGVPGLLPAGLAMIAAAVFSILILHRGARRPLLPGLCFPLAVPLCVVLLLRAGWLGMVRGGIVWRGTLYPSGPLREGSRVKLP